MQVETNLLFFNALDISWPSCTVTWIQSPQSSGPAESRRSPVPDISSLVTEVLTAANNTESAPAVDIMDNMNNDATNELQPNRECVKEEVPEVADEIDNMNKGTVDPTEDPVNNQNDNNGANVDDGGSSSLQ